MLILAGIYVSQLFIKTIQQPLPTEEEIRAQFEKLDVNKDGTIDANELKKVLLYGEEALTEDEVQQIISEFDVNDDGKLSLEEFLNGILKKTSL